MINVVSEWLGVVDSGTPGAEMFWDPVHKTFMGSWFGEIFCFNFDHVQPQIILQFCTDHEGLCQIVKWSDNDFAFQNVAPFVQDSIISSLNLSTMCLSWSINKFVEESNDNHQIIMSVQINCMVKALTREGQGKVLVWSKKSVKRCMIFGMYCLHTEYQGRQNVTFPYKGFAQSGSDLMLLD